MATIKPLTGYRPKKDIVEKLASPPYDVLNSEEAREYAKGNPYSFLHIVKPEIDLASSIDSYDDSVYAKAKENLNDFIKKGWLVQDEKPMLYIYSQKMGDHLQTGLVCSLSVEEYDNDTIKKHELTRKDKEKDRSRHVETCNGNTGPVFITYRTVDKINSIIEENKKDAEGNYALI